MAGGSSSESPNLGRVPIIVNGRGFEVRVPGDASLLLPSGPWPGNLKSAPVQKGLVLTLKGREVAEEGVGFGVPVAVYRDRTVFPSKGEASLVGVEGDSVVLSKVFRMDAVIKIGLGGRVIGYRPSKSSALGRVLGRVDWLYQRFGTYQRIVRNYWGIERHAGIVRTFVRTEPRGEVGVTYKIGGGKVRVEVDTGGLDKQGCEKVCLLNEQGPSLFRRYLDSKGLRLLDDDIGAWAEVETEWACISSLDGGILFRLWSLPGARLFRGRERAYGYLSWVGLDYEVAPVERSFSYEVEIEAGL